jgi:hypothetical protein
MSKPVPDKAEVALEYPDKLYIGTFERAARFEAHVDRTGIALTLHRGHGEDRKSVRMHFDYGLFAEILQDLARSIPASPPANRDHQAHLAEAAGDLLVALSHKK